MLLFDLYGFTQTDINTIQILIEKAVGILFEAHNSSYLGGNYYRYGAFDSEHFVLQQNLDLVDNEPIEPDYSEYPVLLYVNRTGRSEELTSLITKLRDGVVLLKHKVISTLSIDAACYAASMDKVELSGITFCQPELSDRRAISSY